MAAMKSAHTGTWLLLLALTCCDGRGCDAFTGCGFTPLQNPFPSTERISNAAQVRLTEAGLVFIGANASTLPEVIPAAGLEVAIPRVTRTVDIPVIGSTDFTLCGNDDCTVRVSSMATNVRATPPNAVTLGADVSVVGLPNATNEARFPIRIRGGCSFLGCVINTTCQAALDTGPGTRSFIGIDASSSLLEESEAARSGYTYVSDPSTGVRSATGFETTDVVITDCEGVSGAIFEEIERTVTSTASTAVLAALAPRFTDAVDAELCTLAGSTGCPNGTIADGDGEDAVCRYADDRCAHYLGSDGRSDLGALPLGAVTPAGVAPLQYVLASGGEGEAVNDGLSFFLHGGVLSMSADFQTTPGRNTCVPTVAAPTTPTVERAALFRDDAIPGTDDEAHLAYGISEALLDHAGYAMFDSGLLCLDPGSALGAPIQTGLVSIIASAVDALDYDDARMQLGVGLRPQQPADFSLGATDGDATLTATLPGAELELYVLSDAEPTRLLTLLTDLTPGLRPRPRRGGRRAGTSFGDRRSPLRIERGRSGRDRR